MKYKGYLTVALIILAALFLCAGCGIENQKEDPVTVTLWHVYGGQTDSPLNDLIEEFNQTTGAEENIRIKVTSVSNTNTIHEGIVNDRLVVLPVAKSTEILYVNKTAFDRFAADTGASLSDLNT
ncbi:MAG: hypothetical protein ACI4TA_01640 [Acetatifactor sp.]